jgi:hypothetical protein
MNTELMHKWVAALRSGKYQQGRGVLWNCRTNKYCCLGVLMEVEPRIESNGGLLCPNSLSIYMQVPGFNQDELAQMNDAHLPYKTFTDIADFLERKYLGQEGST